MNPDISEFSYGYCLTEEIIKATPKGMKTTPYFPSLKKEGQQGGGYDVLLASVGGPMFLQFKLSHRMVRKSAVEIQTKLFPPGVPFYRMPLRPLKHSPQHQLLLDLEKAGNVVYYAAPRFDRPYELDEAYLQEEMVKRSIFFRPAKIGALPDAGPHHVSFPKAGNKGWRLSEPSPVEADPGIDAAFPRVAEDAERRGRLALGERLAELAGEMEAILRNRSEHYQPFVNRLSALDRLRSQVPEPEYAAYLARTFFDCQLLLVATT